MWIFYNQKDWFWLILWLIGILIIWIWNILFLNPPALAQVKSGFFNTLTISILVIFFSALLGWGITLLDHWLELKYPGLQIILSFVVNLVRSIPQIVGILIGYVFLTALIRLNILSSPYIILIYMALIIAVFVFLEIFDLLRERITYFSRLDFFDAMRVCGISERYIINREIILRSSLMQIINKMIAIFGAAIFLLCSVDFIISVGLSTDVSAVDLPVTLGSLLAKIDSKQDILAIGYALTHWDYFVRLPFEHLQGITIALLIIFTLLCVYHIANGFAGRLRT
jgi:ABC-type dipeptide/oligopeptide/nickel transport system permease subunit